MTAPCKKTTNEAGETLAECRCPVAEGTYQVGQDGATCLLGKDEKGQRLLWSAAASASDQCITPSE